MNSCLEVIPRQCDTIQTPETLLFEVFTGSAPSGVQRAPSWRIAHLGLVASTTSPVTWYPERCLSQRALIGPRDPSYHAVRLTVVQRLDAPVCSRMKARREWYVVKFAEPLVTDPFEEWPINPRLPHPFSTQLISIGAILCL